MLKRENIGGFWHIRPKILPSLPRPELLRQTQKLKATPLTHVFNLTSPKHPSGYERSLFAQAEPDLLSEDHRLPVRNSKRDSLESMKAEYKLRTSAHKNATQRMFARRRLQEADTADLRTEFATLDRILSPSYTIVLPSNPVKDDHVVSSGFAILDESHQSGLAPPFQEHEIDGQSTFTLSIEEDDSEVEPLHTSSIPSGHNQNLCFEPLQGAEDIYTQDYDEEILESTNADDDDILDSDLDSVSDILGLDENIQLDTEVSPGAQIRDANQEESLHQVRSPEMELQDDIRPAGGAVQSTNTSTEEQPRVPTAKHHQAIAQIAPRERLAPISEFLRQNSARIDDFRARRQVSLATPELDSKGTETTFCRAWDSQAELLFLTDAVLWLDVLLEPFRLQILIEDANRLKPRIEQAVRDFESTGIPSRVCTKQPLSVADRETAQQFSDSIARIQASNLTRTEFLERINIDISMFENLLLSAENIKYRRDLGREYGQKDDLVDGLRRIYSTITCTIPVGLSEQDPIEQPAQPYKVTYGDGPFRPYELPGRPEIFDHESLIEPRLSATGCVGVQLSEYQAPLSQEYWQDLHRAMRETTTAQKLEESGLVKLGKNSASMNRDWHAFYGPIYGTGMANYADTAVQRIQNETNEEQISATGAQPMRLDTEENPSHASRIVVNNSVGSHGSSITTHPQQDSSRRSSTDCSDVSTVDMEVEVGIQANKKASKFCLSVNKPGGCIDRNSCGAESHVNEGKICRHADQCKFGVEKCAYIHNAPLSGYYVQPTSLHPRGSVGSIGPRAQDLRNILLEVLDNPRAFKVCRFINKPQGCKSGTGCIFNHSLKGLSCQDYQQGYCPRDFECPLEHRSSSQFSPDHSQYALSKFEHSHDGFTRERHSSHSLYSGHSDFGGQHEGLDAHSSQIDPRVKFPRFNYPSQLDAELPCSIEYAQSPLDRGLPLGTPTGPRTQHTQPHNKQHLRSTYVKDGREPYRNEPQQRSLKRKEPSDQPQGNGSPLRARRTRNGRLLVREQFE